MPMPGAGAIMVGPGSWGGIAIIIPAGTTAPAAPAAAAAAAIAAAVAAAAAPTGGGSQGLTLLHFLRLNSSSTEAQLKLILNPRRR